MIRLNFIPEQLRKERSGLLSHGVGGVPTEIPVGVMVFIFGFLLLVHFLLIGAFLVQVGGHQVLQIKWNGMAADKKIFDDISNQSKAILDRLSSLKPITSQTGPRWSRVLNDISDSVSKGVWLREIDFSKGLLTISGSSVSKMENEMVAAGNFVSALKTKPSMTEYFSGVEIDSIQRREGVSLAIADFRMKAKRK
jgi:Tfp pilus assembly protein PilN